MSEYNQIEDHVEVPLSSGVDGFLLALRKILTLSRVTDIHIATGGKVTYRRWVREEDDSSRNLEIDFETVAPSSVIRNNIIEDLGQADSNAALCAARMFYRASVDHMFPVAFVCGTNTTLGDWVKDTTSMELVADQFYGLPLIKDRFFDDDILLLCTTYGRGGAVIDIRKSYKVLIPGRDKPVRIGDSDEDSGSSTTSGPSAAERVERVPEMGHPSTAPSGTTAGIAGIPGGAGALNRARNPR